MRVAAFILASVLAACASDPVPIAEGPRHVGTPARHAGATAVAPDSIPVSAGDTARPHVVLENMTATARQITIFGRKPTNADVDADLR